MKKYYFPIVVVLVLAGLSTGYVKSDQRDGAITDIIVHSAVGLFGMCANNDQQMRAHCAAFHASVIANTMDIADQYCCYVPADPKERDHLNWIECPPGDISKKGPQDVLANNFVIYWSRDADFDRLETITPIQAVQEMVSKYWKQCLKNSDVY